MGLFDIGVKKFLKENMYFNKKVINRTNYGKKIIRDLFNKIKKTPKKYIDVRRANNLGIDRSICDFIAGMTDRFAINLHNRIK